MFTFEVSGISISRTWKTWHDSNGVNAWKTSLIWVESKISRIRIKRVQPVSIIGYTSVTVKSLKYVKYGR